MTREEEIKEMAAYVRYILKEIEASRNKPVGRRGLICNLGTLEEWRDRQ